MERADAERLKVDLDELCTDLWHLEQLLLAAARQCDNIRRKLVQDLGEVRRVAENFPRNSN